MSINTTEARELFERTTQGKWKARRFARIADVTLVAPEMTFADWVFCCHAHNNWPEIFDTIERQAKEIERLRLERDVLALNFAGRESGVVVLKRPDGGIEGVAWSESGSASLPGPMLPSYYKQKGGA